jgi:ABC-2 type transport system permease protein
LTAFGLYLLVGIIPWGFFSTVTNMSTGAILSNSGLVRKVAFPRQALVVSQVLFMLVQFSIELTLVSTIATVRDLAGRIASNLCRRHWNGIECCHCLFS